MPTAVSALSKVIYIKKIDSSTNAVMILAQGSNTIDGSSSQILNVQYESMSIVSNGTNFYIF